jgi:hypothetical protein
MVIRPLSREPWAAEVLAAVAAISPVGEATGLGNSAKVGDASRVGVASTTNVGVAVRGRDSVGSASVGVGWSATPQNCASNSAFDAEYMDDTVPGTFLRNVVPSEQV